MNPFDGGDDDGMEGPMRAALGIVLAASLGIISLSRIWDEAVPWLLEHDILVPDADAVVHLPGGVGLDLVRIILIVLLGVVLLLGSDGTRRRRSGD